MSYGLPVFRESLKKCMGAPLGERIVVRPFAPADESDGGIAIPDLAKNRPFAGRLIAAGDQACDKLWDLGVKLGDEVWWAKFGGVIEAWTHITKEGTPGCAHSWSFKGAPQDRTFVHVCSICGAEKTQEPLIVMTADDILVDVDLQERIERGELKRRRGVTEDGRTRYFIERTEGGDSWEY